jgi:hypothetical protein
MRADGEAHGPPPAWDWSTEDRGGRRGGAGPSQPPRDGGFDPTALFALLDALRRAAPAELQERLTGLLREALLTLRSLIDWYLERLDRRPPERNVEDIPID